MVDLGQFAKEKVHRRKIISYTPSEERGIGREGGE